MGPRTLWPAVTGGRGVLIEQAVATFEEIGAVMASVCDEVSARTAAPRVRALAEKAYPLRVQADTLKDQAGPAEAQALHERYASRDRGRLAAPHEAGGAGGGHPRCKDPVDAIQLDGP